MLSVPDLKIMNMPDLKPVTSQIDDDGYAVQEGALNESKIDGLIDAIERQQDGETLLRNGKIFAVRNLLDLPECVVGRGGALLMRPLLLHASSPSQRPAHRRVIHLDFACEQLPNPLKWLLLDAQLSQSNVRIIE